MTSFTFGFALASYAAKPAAWTCPVCSFSGDAITPVVNNQYLTVLLNEVNSADSKISIIMYQMKFYGTNNSVRQLEDALISAAARGVDVRVILDQNEWSGRITSATKENWKAKEYLEENGVLVKLDSLKETSHAKIVLIDGKTVVVGSTNWGFSAFERNNEANVMIKEAPVVAYFDNYFEYLWKNY